MTQPSPYNIALDCLDSKAHSSVTALTYAWEKDGVVRHRDYPFSHFAEQTSRFAHYLRSRGIRPGSRILLRLPNGPEFIIAFLGAMKAGVIPVPSSPLLTASELNFLIQDSLSELLVGSPELCAGIRSPAPVLLTGDEWDAALHGRPGFFDIEPTLPDDPAYWLYTSGTEGVPKAVMHAHRSIPAHDSRVQHWLGLRRGDVVFNTSALNWSYALTAGLLDVWRHGGTCVVYQGGLKPERIIEVLQKARVNIFMSVPGIFRRLASHGMPVESVRACLSAGEKLSPEVREEFKKKTGHEIREGLGMTEHSVYLVQPVGEPVAPGSCGRALPGTRIAILRPDLKEAPAGEEGILASHRSCPGLMLGYFNRAQEEAYVFRGEWFLSGDLATRDKDGNFFFLGRRDDVITAGGYRVSPLEIEACLNSHPAVAESAARGAEIASGKTLIRAFVTLNPGYSPTAEDLMRHCLSRLAKYKQPHEIVFARDLPKTSNGKIKRSSL